MSGRLKNMLSFHGIGLFEYEEYISLKTINDPNEGYACRIVRLQ